MVGSRAVSPRGRGVNTRYVYRPNHAHPLETCTYLVRQGLDPQLRHQLEHRHRIHEGHGDFLVHPGGCGSVLPLGEYSPLRYSLLRPLEIEPKPGATLVVDRVSIALVGVAAHFLARSGFEQQRHVHTQAEVLVEEVFGAEGRAQVETGGFI